MEGNGKFAKWANPLLPVALLAVPAVSLAIFVLSRRDIAGLAFLAAILLWFAGFTAVVLQTLRTRVSLKLGRSALGAFLLAIVFFAADGINRNQIADRQAELDRENEELRQQNREQTSSLQEKAEQISRLQEEVGKLRTQSGRGQDSTVPATRPRQETNLGDLPIVFNQYGAKFGSATLFGQVYPESLVFAPFFAVAEFCVGFNIGGAYDRFEALVGVPDNSGYIAVAIVASRAPQSGVLRKTGTLRSGSPPTRITARITGVVRLDLCGIRLNGNNPTLIWADAKVIKD